MEKTLTPPQVARLLRVRREKIMAWIRTGELRAFNVSTNFRPRYRIEESELEAFKLRRAAVVQPKVVRRRRKSLPPVKDYFPNLHFKPQKRL